MPKDFCVVLILVTRWQCRPVCQIPEAAPWRSWPLQLCSSAIGHSQVDGIIHCRRNYSLVACLIQQSQREMT